MYIPMNTRRDFLKTTTLSAAGLLVADPFVQRALANDQPAGAGLRFRQIHLDYHTSGLIEDVATQFDPTEFAAVMKKASVNSVTCFGRCHHGLIYHDTSKFPERRHPFLKRNLLKEQIDACHRQDIRVPVYVTVQWDQYSAEKHPEWLMRDEQNRPIGSPGPFDVGFYKHLCVLTPYRDFLKAYLAELFEKVPVDGLFLDIHHILPNANQEAVAAMLKAGLDPEKPEVRHQFYRKVMQEFKADITAFVRKLDPKTAIFFNSGHVGPHIRPELSSFSHLELESLPSGGWGYLHFPLTARYARNLGKDVMGMTGKFHTSWGDFHSLKNQAALQFECFTMLALNAKCSVGDQLHPKGRPDAATYDLIGSVYAEVARKEPWCVNAAARTDIGVFSAEEFTVNNLGSRTPDQMMGAVRMLQEGKHQFDVVDSQSDFSGYKVLIMPDVIPVDTALQNKLNTFLSKGGSLIASYQAGLTPDGKGFAGNAFGVELVGEAPYSPDFIVVNGKGIGKDLPDTELVMYLKGMQVKPTSGKVLAQTNVPYFNRTWEHYNSHKHTPSAGKAGYPGVVQNGRVIYFMHPVFTQYARNAPRWCRQLLLNALDILLPEPLVRVPDSPTALIATLNEQKGANRQVLHLLYYVPERRGNDFDIVEDIVPLADTRISIRTDKRPAKVNLVPEGKTLAFNYQSGRTECTLPVLRGHQMIELSF